jgi:hypothetical protein
MVMAATTEHPRTRVLSPDVVGLGGVLAVLVWAAVAPPWWVTVILVSVVAAVTVGVLLRRSRASASWWAAVRADGQRLDSLGSIRRSCPTALHTSRRLHGQNLRLARRLDWWSLQARFTSRKAPDATWGALDEGRVALHQAIALAEADLRRHQQAVAEALAELDILDGTRLPAPDAPGPEFEWGR